MSEETVPSRPPVVEDAEATRATQPPGTAGPASPATAHDPDATHHDPASTIGSAAPVASARAAVPGYEILRELGRGGMGVVYLARQLKLNRIVALKMILSGGHAGAEELERFRTEREAVAQLQHPNIVQIYDSGEHEGLPYFSLEYVGGGTLAERVRDRVLPPEEAARLVEQLARGVAYAHAQGIIHRDLKPENVLLADQREQGTGNREQTAGNTKPGAGDREGRGSSLFPVPCSLFPKITDFGLAKLVELDADATHGPYTTGRAQHTRTGAVVGTPSYMAPEQARGEVRKVGPLADVYALGAILYRLLTGRPPFRAPTAAETLVQVLTEDAPAVAASVPRDLETIALKCLRKDPARRYASAHELAGDLRRYLDGEPVLARPVGRAERAVKWVRRNKGLSAGLAAAVLALVAGTVVSALLAVEAGNAAEQQRKERELADEARKAAVAQKIEADAARKTAVEEKNAADQARKDAEEKQRLLDAALQDARKELRRFNLMHYLDHIAAADKALREWDLPVAAWHLDECLPECRHVEHAYLRKQLAARARTLPAGDFGARGLALARDGKRLYSGGWGWRIRVWDLEAAKEILSLEGKDPALALALSADDKTLFAADGKRIKGWDLPEGKKPVTLGEHTSDVISLALAEHGKRLVSGGVDKTIKVWDLEARKEVLTLPGHGGAVAALVLSADGKRLYSASSDKTIKVWDLEAGKEALTLRGHKWPVTCLALSADGKQLYSGGKDRTIWRWDLETGKGAVTPFDLGDWVESVVLSPDGTRLYAGGWGHTIKVWDLGTSKEIQTIRGHTGTVWSLALSPDGTRLFSASQDGTVKVWNLMARGEAYSLDGRDSEVTCLALSADGKRLYSGRNDKAIKVWDLKAREPAFTLQGQTEEVMHLVVSRDGRRLYSCGDKIIQVWDLEAGKEVSTFTGHTKRVNSLALSADGKRLYSGGEDKIIKVWDLDTGKEATALTGHTQAITCLAVAADGKRLYSRSAYGTISVWDLESGKATMTLPGHIGFNCLALSADGKRLFSGGSDKTIKVWDLQTGKEIVTLRGHTVPVQQLALSADGKRLFSGGVDALKIWDLEAGKEALTLHGHTNGVTSLALSAEGSRLYSCGWERAIKVWDLGGE
jgi:WD40 repeat protein/serine/threonine protein kinase